MRYFDDAGASRQRIDQRIGLGLVCSVEIGVPFIEQVNFRIGRIDDFFQRFQLPFAGRKAELLVHRFGDHDDAVLVIAFNVDRRYAAGELKREPVRGRPIIRALSHLGLEACQQRGFPGAVGAAHIDAPGRMGSGNAQRVA